MRTLPLHRGAAFRRCAVVSVSLFTAFAAWSAHEWDIAVLDELAAKTPPDGVAVLGCMELRGWQVRAFRDQLRQIAAEQSGGITPQFAVAAPVTFWPGGVVPYVFDSSVTAAKQRLFLDAANDWATFANVSFVSRTTETNYILVRSVPGLGGGRAATGMVAPAQTFDIGEGSWNRYTLIHDLGHTLGLAHEHQRTDRDTFVTIQTANIQPGFEAAFAILPGATAVGNYDFLSVMHYRRDSFSTAANLDTIVPKAAYLAFQNTMGNQYDRPLSPQDRTGFAGTYGLKPLPSTVVTTTRDSGPGSLTAAIYRAVDVPGTTITFNIPTSDPGYDAVSGTWTIRPTDQIPKLGRLTTIDATTQPGGAATGPKIVLEGSNVNDAPDVFAHGLKITEDQCNVRGLAIRSFDGDAITMIGTGATDNVITRCHLGCDHSATAGSATGFTGVSVYDGAKRNRIGGPAPSDRNIIAGARLLGVVLGGPGTTDNLVQGNYIGLRPDGVAILPNAGGLQIDRQASGNIVRGNVISGNNNYGVTLIDSGVTGNRVEGNLIGLAASGSFAVPNAWSGVAIFSGADGNRIGGTLASERNVISGNTHAGVYIDGATAANNTIAGNYIGLDPNGTQALPNGWSGVQISGGAKNNTIGGGAGARNVISGNRNNGIVLTGSGVTGNIVAGNTIGFTVTGTAPLGNSWDGVLVQNGAANNRIGGTAVGDSNRIGYNGYRSVLIVNPGSAGNAILGNSLFGVGTAYGIDLMDGGNENSPAPSLTSATMGTGVTIGTSLTASPSTTYRVEFFAQTPDPLTSVDDRRTFIGATNLATNASGQVTADVPLPVTLPLNHSICATATSPANNTSVFSNVIAPTFTDPDSDGLPSVWETTFGLNPSSAADASLDQDGDGLTAYQEFLAGSDPRSSTSRPQLLTPTKLGTDVRVGFSSVLGRIYRIERTSDFQRWELWLENIVGTGSTITFTDVGAAKRPQQFYRLQVGM